MGPGGVTVSNSIALTHPALIVFQAGDVVVRSDDDSVCASSQTIYVLLTGEVQLHISRSVMAGGAATAGGTEDEVMIQPIHSGQVSGTLMRCLWTGWSNRSQ